MNKLFVPNKADYTKSNLSYLLFKNLTAEINDEKIDFDRADFRGSKFLCCFFRNNNFDRADFIDCYLQDVNFINVNFGMALIKNNYFKNVSFQGNIYNDLAVQETTFVDCVFDEEQINWTLYKCKFINCIFKNVAFDHSAIDSNSFVSCTFVNCKMAECHMENIYFTKCELFKVEFDSSYISSYLFKEIDMSKIFFKYRGNFVNIYHFGVEDANLLYDQQRYFNYLNMLILEGRTADLYEDLVDSISNTLKLDYQNRIFNMKNILLLWEFYFDSSRIDFLNYQKGLIYLNSLDFSDLDFDEYGEYESVLYRINKMNNLGNLDLPMLDTVPANEKCICKIHINSTEIDYVQDELNKVLGTVNDIALNNMLPGDKYYEIQNVEQGSIILTIASSLLLVLLFAKVAKSINHDIQIMRIEKTAADEINKKIKKTKSVAKIQNIVSEQRKNELLTEKSYDKTISKLSNAILIGEIISIVISLIV